MSTTTPEQKPTAHQEAFSDVWELIGELAIADRVGPLNKLGAVWNRKLDDQWTLWINGTDGNLNTGEKGAPVALDRFYMYVEFNGWPAGYLNPHGGSIAGGEAANILTFRDALRAAVAQANQVPR
jgi:hypothetical protein